MASKNTRFLTNPERERLIKEISKAESAEQDHHSSSRKSKGQSKVLLTFPATNDQSDGLEDLISALPTAFTNRFGEICWAQGGTGYGWWPSCIYDPRFTIGSTRKQARRQLGRKHLVYFFQCVDSTPFDLLPDSKIVEWHQGLAQGMYLGRTAKATGRHRFVRFQEALQAATIEEGKPQSRRLEWNHREGGHGMANLLPSPIQLVASAKKIQKLAKKTPRPNSKVDPAVIENQPRKRARRSINFHMTGEDPNEGQKSTSTDGSEATLPQGIDLRPRALNHASNAIDNGEADEFFCQVYVTNQSTSLGTCVGFVELPRMDCTFTETRQIILKTLETEGLPYKWRFVHPTLGPLSLQMECSKGAMIPYLQRGVSSKPEVGSGTVADPFKVSIIGV